MTIDGEYEKALQETSDMLAHEAALRELSRGKRVTEFGTRDGMSTRFILAGRPVSLVCYDLGRSDRIDDFYVMCAKEHIEFTFHQKDIEKQAQIAPCDFLFIDAMHNGDSCFIYLRLGHESGAQVMALHDTELFGDYGDLSGSPGIRAGIRRFQEAYPEWKTAYHNPESFGFTVLTRAPLNPEWVKAGICIARGEPGYTEFRQL